jgi:TolB-like protein
MESVSQFDVEEGIIIRQVEKLCQSNELRKKQLLCNFLSYIVSEYLAGRGDQIKGYSIGVDVFGKEEDFDPGEDALVRIHAGRLRRMLELYYLKSGKNDQILIEVPKGTYTPVIRINPRLQPEAKPVQEDPDHISLEPSVILLPFENLTGDPSYDYFAHGFSEELSLELTKFEELILYDLSSSKERPEIKSDPVQRLLRKGARFLIEGSLKQVTGEVKVVVRLMDIVKESQVWAERYVRKLTAEHLNEIQEDMAREIAHRLGNEYGIIFQKLSRDSQRIKPDNMDTYNAMLKYYAFLANQSPEAASEALTALLEAKKKDPESAIVLALLSALLGNRYMLDQQDSVGAYEQMGDLAEKAAVLDPNSSTSMAALVNKCFVHNEKERFFNLADRYLSMVRNNSVKMGSVAFHLSLYGEWERGKLLLDEIFRCCQEYPKYFHGATCLYFYRKQQYEKALAEANKYDMPYLFWGPMLRTAVLGQLDRSDEAKMEIEHLLKLKPDFESKAEILISRFVKEEELVNQLLKGLWEAGLSLTS